METTLKLLTLLFFFGWRMYWWITEKKANKEKPKTQIKPSLFHPKRLSQHSLWFVGLLLFFQLFLNVNIWSMPTNISLPLVGFIFVVIGLLVAIVSRRQLDTNWANAWEYQVKHKQDLVTHGVYSYVRNPIYTGVVLAVIGAELVAQSYLFLIACLFFWGAYKQAKLEEVILEKHFGKQYLAYKQKTKMFFPFIW